MLYVDDQPGNLTVFRASLRRHAHIQTASSGAEALARLKQERFTVVLSDQGMEGLSGVELLREVRRLYPDTGRILLTARRDFSIEDDGGGPPVARLVHKPWSRPELRTIIEEAHRSYRARVEAVEVLAGFGAASLALLEPLCEEADRLAAADPEGMLLMRELLAQLRAIAPAA